MKTAAHGSEAWSSPWQELQRKLALGIGAEPGGRIARPSSKPQVHAAGCWLLRAQARMEPARMPA